MYKFIFHNTLIVTHKGMVEYVIFPREMLFEFRGDTELPFRADLKKCGTSSPGSPQNSLSLCSDKNIQ
jgi:hypothetical protein